MIPWTLFWQIIMLMLVTWMILNGLISAYFTQRSMTKVLDRSDEVIYQGSAES